MKNITYKNRKYADFMYFVGNELSDFMHYLAKLLSDFMRFSTNTLSYFMQNILSKHYILDYSFMKRGVICLKMKSV